MKAKNKLEEYNFRVNSDDWEKIMFGGEEYLVNLKNDIWEIVGGKFDGEQLFTRKSAKREVKKAGMRMPTKDEFIAILELPTKVYTKMLETECDIPNMVFPGIGVAGGSFNRGALAYFWFSKGSKTLQWTKYLGSTLVVVLSGPVDKDRGYSVRCLAKD